MSFNDVIEELYSNGVVREIIDNIGVRSDAADDLEQEIYMILLEYDQDKIMGMYEKGQLKFFIVRIVNNQWFSKTSPFYKKYKKYYSLIDEGSVNSDDVCDDYDYQFED
jgi:hypothetical protein